MSRNGNHLPAPTERKILESTEQPQTDRLLTASELATRWQLPNASSIYRLTREGELPEGVVVRLGARRVRFRLDGVLDFEANGGTKTGA